jgi:hypothetical protein
MPVDRLLTLLEISGLFLTALLALMVFIFRFYIQDDSKSIEEAQRTIGGVMAATVALLSAGAFSSISILAIESSVGVRLSVLMAFLAFTAISYVVAQIGIDALEAASQDEELSVSTTLDEYEDEEHEQ